AKMSRMSACSVLAILPLHPPPAGSGGELLRPDLARESVEHTVDASRLVVAKERVREIDMLVDDHAHRDVAAVDEFVGRGPENGPEGNVEPCQLPALGQAGVDPGIEIALLADDAADNVLEVLEVGLAGQVLEAAYRAACGAFGQHIGKIGPCDIHLVESLHGTETGGAAGERPWRGFSHCAAPGTGDATRSARGRPELRRRPCRGRRPMPAPSPADGYPR